jgi:hypothetical protein
MSGFATRFFRKGSVVIPYDTTMGSAVDINGFTTLPLRSGANRYFVGSGGSNANTGLSHAQRLASLSAAWQKVTSGNGDQILIAEGTSLAETLPQSGDTGGWLGDKPGFSALYPTVFSSYDPADPLNESKYGMGHQRGARPILTAIANGGNGAPAYLAVKGLVLNPGNVSGANLNFVGSALKYILFENCILAYTGVSFSDGGDGVVAAVGQHVIIRNCASYGVWINSSAAVGNVYCDGVSGITYEDNVNYHSGWEIGGGVTRDTLPNAGGPSVFRHPLYIQANCNNIVVRRNLIMDGAADGGIARGNNIAWQQNVTIRCPAGTGLGPGNSAEFAAFPSGVLLDASYNLSVAAIDLNSTNPSGYGYTISNIKSGSRIHHNLLVYSSATSGNNDVTIASTGGTAYSAPTQPCACLFDYNVAYHWSASGNTTRETSTPITNTYQNNTWDSSASGSNINIASATFPNAYTEAQLYSALTPTFASITDYTSLVNYAIANPEAHVQRTMRSLAFAGYAIS